MPKRDRMQLERLYDIQEAAALFDVCATTLKTYIRRGMVTPTQFLGWRRKVLFSWQDIEAQRLIGLEEIGARLRVTTSVLRRLLNGGLLNGFRIGLGVTKFVWFRESQLPEIKSVVQSQVSAAAASIRLIQHVGGVAKALEALQEVTRYGKWQMLGPVRGIAGKGKVWCRCECGRKVQVSLANLKAGRTKGCIKCHKPKRGKRKIFRVGTKFGKWRIVRYEGNYSTQPMYLCQCDCGTERLVNGDNLRSGSTKGCGECETYPQAMQLAAMVRVLREKAGGQPQAIALIQQVAKQDSP